MAKSIKPTLIFLACAALPFILIGGFFLYRNDQFTFKNVAILVILAPLALLVLVILNGNNTAQYGVLSDKQRARDAEKYLNRDSDQDSN